MEKGGTRKARAWQSTVFPEAGKLIDHFYEVEIITKYNYQGHNGQSIPCRG